MEGRIVQLVEICSGVFCRPLLFHLFAKVIFVKIEGAAAAYVKIRGVADKVAVVNPEVIGTEKGIQGKHLDRCSVFQEDVVLPVIPVDAVGDSFNIHLGSHCIADKHAVEGIDSPPGAVQSQGVVLEGGIAHRSASSKYRSGIHTLSQIVDLVNAPYGIPLQIDAAPQLGIIALNGKIHGAAVLCCRQLNCALICVALFQVELDLVLGINFVPFLPQPPIHFLHRITVRAVNDGRLVFPGVNLNGHRFRGGFSPGGDLNRNLHQVGAHIAFLEI